MDFFKVFQSSLDFSIDYVKCQIFETITFLIQDKKRASISISKSYTVTNCHVRRLIEVIEILVVLLLE